MLLMYRNIWSNNNPNVEKFVLGDEARRQYVRDSKDNRLLHFSSSEALIRSTHLPPHTSHLPPTANSSTNIIFLTSSNSCVIFPRTGVYSQYYVSSPSSITQPSQAVLTSPPGRHLGHSQGGNMIKDQCFHSDWKKIWSKDCCFRPAARVWF